jgi:hypothetical protein
MSILRTTLMAGSAILVTGGASQAFEVTGGEISLGYSAFVETPGGETFSNTTLSGSIELGFTRDFSAQVDLSLYQFNQLSALGANNGNNLTLHGIYHIDESISVGGFYGMDRIEDLDLDFYGAEVGYESASFEAEAYFAIGEIDGLSGDGSVIGLSGAFPVADNLDMIGSASFGKIDGGVNFNLIEAGVLYDVSNNFGVSASYGVADGSIGGFDTSSEGYFAVEAEITFGADRGATFGERGILRLIPGL